MKDKTWPAMPYPGLRPFEVSANRDESVIFFGRKKQIYELIDRLAVSHFVAVLGPSGCGKSSLIRIGDGAIERFSIRALRRGIGVVAHHHFILNESLRENLLVADPHASDDQLHRAIEAAQLSGLSKRLNGGLEVVLDPGGRGLSAGEKQRLCIARLLLKKAPIMILDEPWSNIDKDAREKLVQVINTCRKTTTILILTHEIHPSLEVDRQYALDPEKGKFTPMLHH